MNYLDLYKQRFGNATSEQEYLLQQEKILLSQMFNDAPSYKKVKLNGIEYDARVVPINRNRLGETFLYFKVIFKDDVIINLGDIIEFDNAKYLVYDLLHNTILPTCIVMGCLHTIQFTKNNVINSVPCVVSNTTFTLDESRLIAIPFDKIMVLLPYNDITKQIEINDTVLLDGKQLRVFQVDNISRVYNNKGNLILYLDNITASNQNSVDLSSIYIDGLDYLIVGQEVIYKVMNVPSDLQFSFTINNNIVELTILSNLECKIKALSRGVVELVATGINNPSFVAKKTISVSSMF